jgi:AcrR family transcriptional regulator
MTSQPFYISETDSPAKQRILCESLRLFASKGMASTSIRDIGAAAGYTNPALYKHFATKDDLALSLFESCYKEQLARLERDLSNELGFVDKFRAYLNCFAKLFDEDRDAVMFVTDNLAVLWPRVSKESQERTILTVTRETISLGRREGLVSKAHNIDLQVALISGYIAQLTRQLYLGAMKGTAKNLLPKIEPILRAGLA